MAKISATGIRCQVRSEVHLDAGRDSLMEATVKAGSALDIPRSCSRTDLGQRPDVPRVLRCLVGFSKRRSNVLFLPVSRAVQVRGVSWGCSRWDPLSPVDDGDLGRPARKRWHRLADWTVVAGVRRSRNRERWGSGGGTSSDHPSQEPSKAELASGDGSEVAHSQHISVFSF